MKTLTCVTLTLAAAFACPTFAADQPLTTKKIHDAAVVKNQARLAQIRATHAASITAVDGGTTQSGPRVANSFRAYPPSCSADPLPTTPTGSTYTTTMPLYTRDASGNPGVPENVTVTLWRLPCSSSGQLQPYNVDGGANGILMMRIDRSSDATDFLPTFPLVSSSQATSNGTSTANVRSAAEPNTVISEVPFDTVIAPQTTIYVLENYPDAMEGYTYFNYDFDLLLDPVIDDQCTGCADIGVPGYQPASTGPLPIDGFESSAWYDAAHSGEGLMVQIYDNADGLTRTLFAAWYTYDDAGVPFWLSIQGVASYGSTSFSGTPVYYYTGGGFAGDFSGVTQHDWGTMDISFPDCRTMDFDFSGAASDVAGGPAGSGTREFQRLADINGLNCE
jgi:hypothetical protein